MKRLKILSLPVALLVGLTLLAACGESDGSGSADDLPGSHWSLVSLHSENALADTEVTMHLGNEDRLFGTSGCNNYVGTWETGDNDALTLAPGGMTLMACPEPIMQQEQAFLAALTDTATFERDDDALTLRNADDDDLAVLTRLISAELIDTNWQAVYVNNGFQTAVGVLPDTTITALFSEDGTLAGHAGCNTYNTTYTTDGETISIEQPMSTLMACEETILEQETAFTNALASAATFELGVRTLYLRDAEGALLVAFKIADE